MERTGRPSCLAAVLLLALSSACIPSAKGICSQDAECKADEKCSAGLCIKLSVLAPDGSPDAGVDAGSSDAGADAGNADAGTSDAGSSDAGNSDAGTSDAGTPDAGTPDGGSSDAGAIDAGCTGPACTASLTITSPAATQLVGGTVHVEATVSASVAPSAITFSLGVSGGSELGTVVPIAAGSVYSGDIVVTDARAEGAAKVSATMTIAGTAIAAAPVAVSLDQAPPGVTGYSVQTPPDFLDGGPAWYRASGTAVVLKAQLDAGSPLDGGSIEVDWTANGSPGSASWDKSPQNAPPPWFFYVPRAAGAGLEGAQTFTLHVADVLGNGNRQDVQVAFDDVAPSFLPALDLPAPGTWVARVVTAGFNQQSISIGAVDHGTGVGLVTAQPAGGVQVPLGATAQPNVYSNPVDLSHAPPSSAGSYDIAITAQDQLGNTATGAFALLVDDVSPTITPATDSRWYGIPGALTVTPALTVTDQGSGVSSATFTVSGGSVSAKLGAGGNGLSGTWTASQPLTLPTAPREAPLPIALQATDAVGNVSSMDAAFTVNFDNVAPLVSGVVAVSPDANIGGQPWYRGSSAASGTVDVAATIVDGNLATKAPNGPQIIFTTYSSGVAVSSSIPGTLNADGRWHFSVPRLSGQNATSSGTAYTVVAKDLAGNVSTAAGAQLTLYFDDAAQDTFRPVVAADSTWYSRKLGAAFNQVAANATLTVPLSGTRSLVMMNGGTAVGACSAATGACTLNASNAPANTEAAYPFTLVATSGVGVTSTSAAIARNIDDLPPVIDASAATPYPAADPGPLSWSHDGSHFNLRDSGPLHTFTAYDCGAGVSTATPTFSVTGSPPSRAVAVSAAGTHSCANGNVATLTQYVVSSAFTGLPVGTYAAADNVVSVGLTLSDSSSGLPSSASSSAQINVTRRLWLTNDASAPGYTTLGLGPARVFALGSTGLLALNKATGAKLGTVDAAATGQFAIASNGGTPVAFVNEGDQTLRAVDVNSATQLGSCTLKGTGYLGGTYVFDGVVLRDAATALAWSQADQATGCFCGDCVSTQLSTCKVPTCGTCGTATAQQTVFTQYTLTSAGSCSTSTFSAAGLQPGIAAVSANNNLISVTSESTGTCPSRCPQSLSAQPIAGGTTVTTALSPLVYGLALGSGPTGTTDSVYLLDANGIERYDYSGSFSGKWSKAASGPVSVQAGTGGYVLARGSAGMQVLTLAGVLVGGPIGAGSAIVAPLIDGSAAPIAYFPDTTAAGLVQANLVGGSGLGASPFALPPLPAATSDQVLASDGTLFVSSAGRVYAMITDSPVGPAAGAWTSALKDACHSSNLGYTCPY